MIASVEALKRVLTALTLWGNVTPEVSLSSGKHWVRCENNTKHNKNISGTPVIKYKNYTELFIVCSCWFWLLKRCIFILSSFCMLLCCISQGLLYFCINFPQNLVSKFWGVLYRIIIMRWVFKYKLQSTVHLSCNFQHLKLLQG